MPCNLGKESLVLTFSLGVPSIIGGQSRQRESEAAARISSSQEGESQDCLYSAHVLRFPQSRAYGLGMLSSRVTLPTASKLTDVSRAQGLPPATASWGCLEACLLDDSRPFHVDSINHHKHHGWCEGCLHPVTVQLQLGFS